MGSSPVRPRPRAVDAAGVGRFGVHSALGLAALLLGAVPFLALLVLVQQRWPPLAGLDEDVAGRLNGLVAGSPLAVDLLRVLTDGGGTGTATYVLVLLTAVLLVRHQRRLAAYVAATGLGLVVLVPVTKALVGRARPDVALPVVDLPANASFPSGHAMTSLVTWGVVVLVALPAVRRSARRWLVAAAVALVLGVGFTRLALGVHFVTDVLAGYSLGAAWLAMTTAAFRGWQADRRPLAAEVDDRAGPELTLAPTRSDGQPSALRLALAWVAVLVVLVAVGLLVTQGLRGTTVGRIDDAAVRALVQLRTPARNEVVDLVGRLSGTRAVVVVSLATAVLGYAVTASRRVVLFVALAVLGEVSLYFVTGQVVGRARPDVPDLTSGLPVGASFPSGHVAAAVVVYGALAVLVGTYATGRWRWAVVVLPLPVVPAVALSRVYEAAHHPTDVLGGALLGGLWLLAVSRLVALPHTRWDGPVRTG